MKIWQQALLAGFVIFVAVAGAMQFDYLAEKWRTKGE